MPARQATISAIFLSLGSALCLGHSTAFTAQRPVPVFKSSRRVASASPRLHSVTLIQPADVADIAASEGGTEVLPTEGQHDNYGDLVPPTPTSGFYRWRLPFSLGSIGVVPRWRFRAFCRWMFTTMPVIPGIVSYSVYMAFPSIVSSAIAVLEFGAAKLKDAPTETFGKVFLPSTGLLLGTLTALTIGTLQQRQLDIRRILQEEISLIDLLEKALKKLFQDDPIRRRRAFRALWRYTWSVAGEATTRGCQTRRQWWDAKSPLVSSFSTIITSLPERIKDETEEKDEVYDSGKEAIESLSDLIDVVDEVTDAEIRSSENYRTLGTSQAFNQVFYIQGLLTQLRHTRGAKVVAVQTGFPAEHYLLLAFLGISQLVAFIFDSLKASSNPLLRLLPRLAFSLLVGAFMWLGILLEDLTDPFSGKYSISTQPLKRTLKRLRDAMIVS